MKTYLKIGWVFGVAAAVLHGACNGHAAAAVKGTNVLDMVAATTLSSNDVVAILVPESAGSTNYVWRKLPFGVLKHWLGTNGSIGGVLSNGVNYGSAFRSPGTGAYSEQFGYNASAAAPFSFAAGYGAAAELDATNGIGLGYAGRALGPYAVGINASASAWTIAVGGDDDGFTNCVLLYIKPGQRATRDNQGILGTSQHWFWIPGSLSVDGVVTNLGGFYGDLVYGRFVGDGSGLTNISGMATNTLTPSQVTNLVSLSTNSIPGMVDGKVSAALGALGTNATNFVTTQVGGRQATNGNLTTISGWTEADLANLHDWGSVAFDDYVSKAYLEAYMATNANTNLVVGDLYADQGYFTNLWGGAVSVSSLSNTGNTVLGGDVTVSSDITASNLTWSGEEYLQNWNAKVAYIASGVATQAVFALIGDSWTAWGYITEALTTNLQNRLGNGGPGWVNFSTNLYGGIPKGVGFAWSGPWTNNFPTNGLAVSAITSTNAGDSISVTSVVNRLVLHYMLQPNGGKFSYVLDGAAPITNDTANATLAAATLTIGTNLNLTSNHVAIFSVADAGTAGVTLCGADLQNSGTGFRLHNLGYSGSRASDWVASWVSSNIWQSQLAAIDPDTVGILLGTNEKLGDQTPATYTNKVLTLVNRIRAAKTNADIVLISAGDNGGGGTNSMGDYALALQNLARAQRLPFVDGYLALGPYAYANGRGLYQNSTHVNRQGAQVLADKIAGVLAVNPLLNNKVGIGVKSPVANLQVAGTTYLNGGLTNNGNVEFTTGSIFHHAGNVSAGYYTLESVSGGRVQFKNIPGYDFETYFGGAYGSALYITTNRFVGVGVTNPTAPLHVRGSAIVETNLWLGTNAVCPTPLAGGGWLWNSNQALYWVTPTKTNLITDGL